MKGKTMKKGLIFIILSLLSIYVVFFLYLKYPQLETFFGFYTNGCMFFVIGMLEGHNYGLCKKCGKNHGEHPRGMLGKKHPNPGFKKGMTAWNKGLTDWMSEEGKANIAKSNRMRINSPETRYKMGSGVRGKPSHRKGKHLPLLHCLRIALAWRTSPNNREGIRKYHEERNLARVKEFYGMSDDEKFIALTPYEHWFVRKILIEGKRARGFYTQSGLSSRPDFIKNNAYESEIPVTV